MGVVVNTPTPTHTHTWERPSTSTFLFFWQVIREACSPLSWRSSLPLCNSNQWVLLLHVSGPVAHRTSWSKHHYGLWILINIWWLCASAVSERLMWPSWTRAGCSHYFPARPPRDSWDLSSMSHYTAVHTFESIQAWKNASKVGRSRCLWMQCVLGESCPRCWWVAENTRQGWVRAEVL